VAVQVSVPLMGSAAVLVSWLLLGSEVTLAGRLSGACTRPGGFGSGPALRVQDPRCPRAQVGRREWTGTTCLIRWTNEA
jgi:hypothetical protein